MSANQLALVTGSTSGIGLGIAKHFASQGKNIVLNGFGDAVCELLVLGRNRKFIKVNQLKKKRCFHFC
jgi:NAD(P)-dependent dehydrogenase (short-subunit alcohol dehydrogenase family)